MRGQAQAVTRSAMDSNASGQVVPLRQLPPNAHVVVSVLRRELHHEAIETAEAIGCSSVRPMAVVEALVARGWLPTEAVARTLRLDCQLHSSLQGINMARARELEADAQVVIGWLRLGANRAVGGQRP